MNLTFGNVKPFSPEEAKNNQASNIPDVVFEAVNRMLTRQALSQRITIRKPDLIEEILSLGGPDQHQLLSNHWLDIEIAYRAQGWDVNYESPDWGDSGPGYFTFARRKAPFVPQPSR